MVLKLEIGDTIFDNLFTKDLKHIKIEFIFIKRLMLIEIHLDKKSIGRKMKENGVTIEIK